MAIYWNLAHSAKNDQLRRLKLALEDTFPHILSNVRMEIFHDTLKVEDTLPSAQYYKIKLFCNGWLYADNTK